MSWIFNGKHTHIGKLHCLFFSSEAIQILMENSHSTIWSLIKMKISRENKCIKKYFSRFSLFFFSSVYSSFGVFFSSLYLDWVNMECWKNIHSLTQLLKKNVKERISLAPNTFSMNLESHSILGFKLQMLCFVFL